MKSPIFRWGAQAGLFQWALAPVTSVLITDAHGTDTGRRGDVMTEQRLEGGGHRPGNANSHQELEEVWEDGPLKPPGRTAPSTAWF